MELTRRQVYEIAVRLRSHASCEEGNEFVKQWLAHDTSQRTQLEAVKLCNQRQAEEITERRWELTQVEQKLEAVERERDRLTAWLQHLRSDSCDTGTHFSGSLKLCDIDLCCDLALSGDPAPSEQAGTQPTSYQMLLQVQAQLAAALARVTDLENRYNTGSQKPFGMGRVMQGMAISNIPICWAGPNPDSIERAAIELLKQHALPPPGAHTKENTDAT